MRIDDCFDFFDVLSQFGKFIIWPADIANESKEIDIPETTSHEHFNSIIFIVKLGFFHFLPFGCLIFNMSHYVIFILPTRGGGGRFWPQKNNKLCNLKIFARFQDFKKISKLRFCITLTNKNWHNFDLF